MSETYHEQITAEYGDQVMESGVISDGFGEQLTAQAADEQFLAEARATGIVVPDNDIDRFLGNQAAANWWEA